LTGSPRISTARARLYQTVRTAHLERAHELTPAAIIYRSRRYDFDVSLADGLQLVEAGPARAALTLATSRVIQLEINEPLMRSSVRGTALALAALRLRELLGGPHTTVVAYAIGNDDPTRGSTTRRARISIRLDLVLMRYLWRRVDRIAYGTTAARTTYREVLGAPPPSQAETLIQALPRVCECADGTQPRDPLRLVFLGAFVERKGFPLLLDAWPLLRSRVPGASLTLVGKGRLQPLAERAAATDDSIELVIDPSRAEIHRRLAGCRVLALPSQPTPSWREQVGLPIVEGLSHGCAIVATTETGLAHWLTDHGHGVLDTPTTPEALADALALALTSGPQPADITASLPAVDGRLAADEWMFAGMPGEQGTPVRRKAHRAQGR
jgi:glycosyltransferase involved in cell wall biosynthesis